MKPLQAFVALTFFALAAHAADPMERKYRIEQTNLLLVNHRDFRLLFLNYNQITNLVSHRECLIDRGGFIGLASDTNAQTLVHLAEDTSFTNMLQKAGLIKSKHQLRLIKRDCIFNWNKGRALSYKLEDIIVSPGDIIVETAISEAYP